MLPEGSVWSCAVCVYRPDAEQALLPAGGMLARHQSQPGGKLPTVLARARVTDRCHEGCRREGTNAWNRHQALALGMRRHHGFEFLLVIGQVLLQQGKLVHELPTQRLA